jgi:hypothetical protein
MRRFVMAHQEKWLRLVAALKPIDAEVADQIGTVAFVFLPAGSRNEFRIVIQALTRQDVPIIETRRIVLQVPLSDDRCLVPRLL